MNELNRISSSANISSNSGTKLVAASSFGKDLNRSDIYLQKNNNQLFDEDSIQRFTNGTQTKEDEFTLIKYLTAERNLDLDLVDSSKLIEEYVSNPEKLRELKGTLYITNSIELHEKLSLGNLLDRNKRLKGKETSVLMINSSDPSSWMLTNHRIKGDIYEKEIQEFNPQMAKLGSLSYLDEHLPSNEARVNSIVNQFKKDNPNTLLEDILVEQGVINRLNEKLAKSDRALNSNDVNEAIRNELFNVNINRLSTFDGVINGWANSLEDSLNKNISLLSDQDLAKSLILYSKIDSSKAMNYLRNNKEKFEDISNKYNLEAIVGANNGSDLASLSYDLKIQQDWSSNNEISNENLDLVKDKVADIENFLNTANLPDSVNISSSIFKNRSPKNLLTSFGVSDYQERAIVSSNPDKYKNIDLIPSNSALLKQAQTFKANYVSNKGLSTESAASLANYVEYVNDSNELKLPVDQAGANSMFDEWFTGFSAKKIQDVDISEDGIILDASSPLNETRGRLEKEIRSKIIGYSKNIDSKFGRNEESEREIADLLKAYFMLSNGRDRNTFISSLEDIDNLNNFKIADLIEANGEIGAKSNLTTTAWYLGEAINSPYSKQDHHKNALNNFKNELAKTEIFVKNSSLDDKTKNDILNVLGEFTGLRPSLNNSSSQLAFKFNLNEEELKSTNSYLVAKDEWIPSRVSEDRLGPWGTIDAIRGFVGHNVNLVKNNGVIPAKESPSKIDNSNTLDEISLNHGVNDSNLNIEKMNDGSELVTYKLADDKVVYFSISEAQNWRITELAKQHNMGERNIKQWFVSQVIKTEELIASETANITGTDKIQKIRKKRYKELDNALIALARVPETSYDTRNTLLIDENTSQDEIVRHANKRHLSNRSAADYSSLRFINFSSYINDETDFLGFGISSVSEFNALRSSLREANILMTQEELAIQQKTAEEEWLASINNTPEEELVTE
ncbi:MAG: hypothetical protein HRT47_00645 [Candidatus Caenarcaniphilales bacterium]|nr:hypothetical protein [Candidatus Caenarcaniphilales bacterium]